MDRELEQQIDEIINKSSKDLKSRISRIVVRHQTKLLKDQARELKSGVSALSTRKGKSESSSSNKNTTSKVDKSTKKDDKYRNDSDTDGYYSE